MTFEAWMKKVDARINSLVGLDHDDLADWRWYDAWEDGYTPEDAVEEFFEDEGMDEFL